MAQHDAGSPIELVVFDLGGVLVRIPRDWAEARALAGLPPHPIVEEAAFRAAGQEAGAAHQRCDLSPAEWARAIERHSRGGYSAETALAVLDAWIVEAYAGTAAALDALDATSTAVLSKTNRRHWAHPLQTAIAARVWHAHASHLLRVLKPEPAIYARFEAAVGVRGPAILFIDDTAANVEAARARGWRAEHIDHTGDTAAQLLDALRAHGVIAGG